MLGPNAEPLFGTCLRTMAVRYFTVCEFPCHRSGRTDASFDFELTRPAPVDRSGPNVVFTRAVDLGLEELQIDPHEASLGPGLGCGLGHPECPNARPRPENEETPGRSIRA